MFLTSRFGGWLAVGLIVTLAGSGLFLHLRANANTIAALNKQVALLALQAQSLQSANDALQSDIADVAQAQAVTNSAIAVIRSQAANNTRTVVNRTFNPKNPEIQQQINKETADLFKRLEDQSNAH